MPDASRLSHLTTATALEEHADLARGDWVQTAGFHHPGDGGAGLYRIADPQGGPAANGADAIALGNGLLALLEEGTAVSYRQFGTLCDGLSDDGAQIRLAHEYANRRRLPVVQRSGEFWIRDTNNIPIQTSVDWGQATFYIDETMNSRQYHRFVVSNDRPAEELALEPALKKALLRQVRPGVQLIPELAPYAGCLVSVVDENDRIGIRAGNYQKRGWAREELFYVEEEGRIVGDIAWEFADFTSVLITPCNDNYLVLQGGGFYFSGDTPASGEEGYHRHGMLIERSRTVVREQWMGLEPGKADVSMEPRAGLYVLSHVYDVTLESIRAMPWEKNRVPKEREVKHGTYGIGGARMLNCQFRNLTAEGGWVAWGVFGTNLNKNFRVENCRLNRIDVHFHCWNLYIRDCTIGFKGISVTGGGDLVIENTVRHGTTFVSFRPDYGARWDGHIRIRGCTFKPSGPGETAVLSYRPHNFDYQYPIGYARTIVVDDLVIDYGAVPDSTAVCWLMQAAPFARTDDGTRLFFPHRVTFRDIVVEGREQGVRVLRICDPGHLDAQRPGSFDGTQLEPNCTILCEAVQLESLAPDSPEAHLVVAEEGGGEYADERSLRPLIRFVDCRDVKVILGDAEASARFERCTVRAVRLQGQRGEVTYTDCRVRQG